MRVLISLPVHECRRVIEDQLRNLSYYFDDPFIILHLSRTYAESADFSELGNVLVNPTRYATAWGNISYLHYANVQFALDKHIPFEYVVFCSSNELYIRKGVEEYLRTAKAFVDTRGIISDDKFLYAPKRNVFYAKTAVIAKAYEDRRLRDFVRKHKLPGILKSQIEGSAYHRSVILRMWKILREEFSMEYMQSCGYCAEEILIPTVFLAVQKKTIPKRQFSYVDWYHDLTPRLWILAIQHWRGRQRRKISTYLKSICQHPHIYAIKGVKRTYYDKIRRYVRESVPQPRLRLSVRIRYILADIGYNLRIIRAKLSFSNFPTTLAQWTLGIASRMISKPKGYLKWRIRTKLS